MISEDLCGIAVFGSLALLREAEPHLLKITILCSIQIPKFNSNTLNRIGLTFGNGPPSVEEKYC